MPLASSSSTQMRYIAESVFGVTPVAGNPRNLRITGDSFDFTLSKDPSKEINSTRTITSVAKIDQAANGGVQAEFSYQEYDALLAATLMSTWTVFGTNGVTGTASLVAATATTLTASVATTGNDNWANLQKGQWFLFLHPSTPNDNKLFRVSPTVAPTSTVITLDPNTPAAVQASVAGGKICTSRLTHGTTMTSFTFERAATDINQFMAYTGQVPSKMSVQVQSASLSSISFDFMGKSMNRAAATQLPGSPVSSYNFDITSGVSGTTSALWENGAPISGTFVKSLTLDYDNSLRAQGAIANLGPVGMGVGTIQATVNMSVYFADGALFDRFKSNANSGIVFSSLDDANNGYVFSLPVCNITTAKITNGAKDTDLMVDVTFTALRDEANATAALKKAIFIDRVGVATS